MQAVAARCATMVLGLLALGACAGRPAPPLAPTLPIVAPPPIEDAPAAAATPAAEDPSWRGRSRRRRARASTC